ncbi:MAG TPA: MFS transporter [Thermomicrobiales bacterium]|nr:MFS transporter [Thermomicrobiales bacterium]
MAATEQRTVGSDIGEAPAATALPAGGPWSPPYRGLTAGLLITVAGMAFESLAVATVMPETAADLHGLGLYGAVFSAFLLTNLVGIVASGLLADRDGPAMPFLGGILLFVAGLFIGGFAPSMPVLIGGRALQGFGAGAVSAISYVALGRAYPAAAKPQMLAYLSTAWVVPGLVGPGIAGLIGETVGWRWVFLGLIPLPLVAMTMALPALRRIPGGVVGADSRARLRGAALLAAGAALLLGGMTQPNLLLLAPMVVVGAAIAIPALRGLLPPGALRARPGLPAAILTMLLLNVVFVGIDAFLALALVDVRGRSIAFAGIAFTAATITWTTGSWLQARFSNRASRRVLIRAGLTILLLGGATVTSVLWPQVPVALGIAGWGIAGLGIGLAYSTLSLVVLENASPGQEGEASASLQLASVLGSGLGAGIGGAVINAIGHDRLGDAVLAQYATMLAILVVALALSSRLPGRAPAP